ncbi:SRPBCC family protein [Corallococcus macrosporus]|uniref:Aha1 domain-containing protein n=1 Tax=Myxococcus fulvus (strain ATCC BAA-855 / HW-1) TaxID=483219 RepID=F8CGI7_MYXFH|nr:SRPBCC domain-containing protein [Corallococcus macrosporus]AEI68722.1 Aha1 domain-containing protein [Corallococcus macrosporus]
MSNEKAKVVIERSYRAGIQDIWALWTTKEGFESWWGPQGFRAEVHELDARVGGALRYDMIADSPEMIAAMKQAGEPTSHATRSRFTEVAPHSRLVLTNVIDFLPGVATYESNIAVDFLASGDRVRMVVTLDAMHSDEFTKMQQEGFTSQLTKLDSRFA